MQETNEKYYGKLEKQDIKKHLRSLGFDDIPEDLLEEFVADLRKLISLNESEISLSEASSNHKKNHSYHKKESGSSNFKKIYEPSRRVKATVREFYDEETFEESNTNFDENDEMTFIPSPISLKSSTPSIDKMDVTRTKSKVTSSTNIETKPRLKIHDPVNRFHAMQDVWKKDKFLQSLSKPRRFKITYPSV